MTLPLGVRNRLASLILDAFHDAAARAGLEALCAGCADLRGDERPPPLDPFLPGAGALPGGLERVRDEVCERAGRGWRVVKAWPLLPADAPLSLALDTAAALFGAGLYFEVHERIEPYWMRATGPARDALQGLIQVAVGFQHLANGNVAGARALLGEGAARLTAGRLAGVDLTAFASGARRCQEAVRALGDEAPPPFDWTTVPRFPCPDAMAAGGL